MTSPVDRIYIFFYPNESLKGIGVWADRHVSIGQGAICKEGLRFIMKDPRLADINKVIETGGEEFDGVYLTLLIKLLIEDS